MNGACPPFSPAFFLLVTLPCLSLGTSIYSFLPRCLFDIVSQLLIVVSIFQLLVLLLRALIPDSLELHNQSSSSISTKTNSSAELDSYSVQNKYNSDLYQPLNLRNGGSYHVYSCTPTVCQPGRASSARLGQISHEHPQSAER